MSIGQSIRAGVAWLMFGNTGSQVISFLFGIALARLLFPADFGMIATVQILTGLVSLVTSGGMAESLVRAKQAEERDFDVVFSLQLAIGVLACVAVFAVAPWFARFFEDPLYVGLLAVSAMNFLLRPFAMVRSAWLTREMNFRMSAFANLVATVATGASGVAMALVGMGVWSLAFGGLVAAFTLNFMLYWLTPLRLRLRMDVEVAKRHSAFGLKITFLDLLAHFGREAIKAVMSKLAGPAFLGLFVKADSLSRMPSSFIHPATNRVVFRALSKITDDHDQSKYLLHRTIALLCLYTFPFLIGLMWLAEPLILVVYGERWLPAAEPARILALAGFFFSIGRPCSALLHAHNRLDREIILQSVVLVVSIPACVVGLRWGLAGVAWTLVIVQVAAVAFFYFLAYRTIPMRFADLIASVRPALLLSALLVAALALASGLSSDLRSSAPLIYLILMTGIGGGVYATAFFFLPIPGLEPEVARWKSAGAAIAQRVHAALR